MYRSETQGMLGRIYLVSYETNVEKWAPFSERLFIILSQVHY